jgi:hypothetical protein
MSPSGEALGLGRVSRRSDFWRPETTQSPRALEHIFGSIIEAHGGRQSAPNRRIGTFGLVVVATCAFSLGIAV